MRNRPLDIVSGMIVSSLLGLLCSWGMWMWIYGIGCRVIQDHEHYDFATIVQSTGTVISIIIGLACVFLSRRPILSPIVVHAGTMVMFVAMPMDSWQAGIRNYITGLILFTAVTLFLFKQRKITIDQQSTATTS